VHLLWCTHEYDRVESDRVLAPMFEDCHPIRALEGKWVVIKVVMNPHGPKSEQLRAHIGLFKARWHYLSPARIVQGLRALLALTTKLSRISPLCALTFQGIG
jgi:hypothetical protein